jgi:hypothetical protein
MLVHKQCLNPELKVELLKLAKLFLSQSILLNGNDEALMSVLDFFLNPLIGETQKPLSIQGLKDIITDWNENIPEGYCDLELLPLDFIFDNQADMDIMLAHCMQYYCPSIVEQVYLFESREHNYKKRMAKISLGT